MLPLPNGGSIGSNHNDLRRRLAPDAGPLGSVHMVRPLPAQSCCASQRFFPPLRQHSHSGRLTPVVQQIGNVPIPTAWHRPGSWPTWTPPILAGRDQYAAHGRRGQHHRDMLALVVLTSCRSTRRWSPTRMTRTSSNRAGPRRPPRRGQLFRRPAAGIGQRRCQHRAHARRHRRRGGAAKMNAKAAATAPRRHAGRCRSQRAWDRLKCQHRRDLAVIFTTDGQSGVRIDHFAALRRPSWVRLTDRPDQSDDVPLTLHAGRQDGLHRRGEEDVRRRSPAPTAAGW